MNRHPFITKLHLRQFRSIRNATVAFDNPLFLVGRNASGKSNFVDALAFLFECTELPLQTAINRRNGLGIVHNRPHRSKETLRFAMRIEFRLPDDTAPNGHYALSVGADEPAFPSVLHEQCIITKNDGDQLWFDRAGSIFKTNIPGVAPEIGRQALALPIIGGVKPFSFLVRALAAMRVYSIVPSQMRDLMDFDNAPFLNGDGSNVASTIHNAQASNRATVRRINELLKPIAPNIVSIGTHVSRQGKAYLVYSQKSTDVHPLFDASDMSDGTLKALGVIVAALQEPAPSVIVIEEPEASLHPGALSTIADLIDLASERTQVIVTTHSPDLLDAKWIKPENLRVVEWAGDSTRISPLGEVPVQALQQHLMGAGELLRSNALDAAPYSEETDADLFDRIPA